MKTKLKNNGSVFLVTVFTIAMLSAMVAGILQITAEEIQLMQNHIYAAEATATAEAGLNDAFAQIRVDSNCVSGMSINESFNGGSYSVTADGNMPDPNIISEATSSQGYVARVKADLTVGDTSPYIIRVDSLRINE